MNQIVARQETNFAKLYPLVADRNAEAIVLTALLPGEKSKDGYQLLSRALHQDERQLLQARYHLLTQNLQAASQSQIETRVMRMFIGFQGPDMSEKQARVVGRQFAIVLADLPFWAIERACQRFERGEVKTEDAMLEGVNQRRGPTTAQLCTEARSMVSDFYAEQDRVQATLKGVVERYITPEEREQVRQGFEELAASLRASYEEAEMPHKALKGLPDAEEMASMQSAMAAIYSRAGAVPAGQSAKGSKKVKEGAGQR
jgi:hypothetical protein